MLQLCLLFVLSTMEWLSINIDEIRQSLAVRPQQECDIIVDPTRRESLKTPECKADQLTTSLEAIL